MEVAVAVQTLKENMEAEEHLVLLGEMQMVQGITNQDKEELLTVLHI